MRKAPLWAMLFALLLTACSTGLDNDDDPTQTPIIVTATPASSAATATDEPTATPLDAPTTAPSPTAGPAASPTTAPTATAAAQPTATQAATATATEPPAVEGEIELLQAGYSQSAPGELISWGFIIQNSNPELAVEDLEYRVIFFDDAGVVVETEESTVPLIFPGQRTGFASSIFVDDDVAAASMEVQVTPGTTTTVEVAEGFAVDNVNYFGDEFFPRVTALVNNPLPNIVTDLRVSAITFDAEGNINGGGFTFLSTLAPSGQTGVDVSVDSVDVASAEVFANVSFLTDTIEANLATDPVLAKFGFGQEAGGTNVGWGAIIENPNASDIILDSEVQVWFEDAEGRVLDASSTRLDAMPPGGSIGIADDFVFLPDGTTATTMNIILRPGTLEATDLTSWFTVEDVAYVDDAFFPEVTGTVVNPFPTDLEDLYATAIAYDEADNIIGGGFTFVDLLLANGRTGVAVGVTTSATPARVEIYVFPSSLTDF